MEPVVAIGLMSGTSLDGVDAAAIETDGERIGWIGPALTEPYPEDLREALRALLGRRRGGDAAMAQTERAMTLFHAQAVRALQPALSGAGRRAALLGFHGQTLLHRPAERYTLQIGDGALLARACGIETVADFRSADVAAGGQGAPLVPLYHAALAADLPKPVAVLNIGGVANVTWIGEGGAMLAFDTGPGNAPIDDWVRRHGGGSHDQGGAIAAAGDVDEPALAAMLASAYFMKPAPKSLDRDDFNFLPCANLGLAAGAATLSEFTVRAIVSAQRQFPKPARQWIVCGGGRHNAHLMRRLAALLAPAAVGDCDALGWHGDALEAQAFAYLAVRAKRGLPLSLPTTTGVPRPMPGGRIFSPD